MPDARWGDPRDQRDRSDEWPRVYDARDRDERDPWDALMRDVDLPRGEERELVVDRDRVYELDGEDSRTLAAVGAFRVVPEHDLDVPHETLESISDVTRQEIQAFVAHLNQAGYAPKTIDHIHDVLSALLRTAVKWGHLQTNPARDVDMPTLKTVRPKWVLTIHQATQLLDALPPLGRTMVGIALLSGLRRGELFALRWQDVDEGERMLRIQQAVYEGSFDSPKTAAGVRQVPLSDGALKLLAEWKARAKRTDREALVFSTWSGKPISPNNVVRQ